MLKTQTPGSSPSPLQMYSSIGSDYYPFGSAMPTRSWSDANRQYRYGFNNMEKDFETANDNYDFGARIYDGRLGRWLSLDPLMRIFPSISSFVFSLNCPVAWDDEDGRQPKPKTAQKPKTVKPKKTADEIQAEYEKKAKSYMILASSQSTTFQTLVAGYEEFHKAGWRIRFYGSDNSKSSHGTVNALKEIWINPRENKSSFIFGLTWELTNVKNESRFEALHEKVRNSAGDKEHADFISKENYVKSTLSIEAEAKFNAFSVLDEMGLLSTMMKDNSYQDYLNYKNAKPEEKEAMKQTFLKNSTESMYQNGTVIKDGELRMVRDVYGEGYDELVEEGKEKKENDQNSNQSDSTNNNPSPTSPRK